MKRYIKDHTPYSLLTVLGVCLAAYWSTGCAQKRDPIAEYNSVAMVLLCKVGEDPAVYEVLEVMKDISKSGVLPNSRIRVKLTDPSLAAYPIRLVLLATNDVDDEQRFVGLRDEYIVSSDQIIAYGNLPLGEYRKLVMSNPTPSNRKRTIP